jgi:hypothetical protein
LNHDYTVKDEIPECESAPQPWPGTRRAFVAQAILLFDEELRLRPGATVACRSIGLFEPRRERYVFIRLYSIVSILTVCAISLVSATPKGFRPLMFTRDALLCHILALYFRTGPEIHRTVSFPSPAQRILGNEDSSSIV